MNNEPELDALIQEIAVKHGIAVGRDDPILILQTLNNTLIKDHQKAQQALLEQFKSELEDISVRWRMDAKAQAERILNASLDASQAAMERLQRTGVKETVTAIKSEVDLSINRIRQPVKEARLIGLMNLIAAGMTLLAVLLLGITQGVFQ